MTERIRYLPWNDDPTFLEAIRDVTPNTLVPPDRLYTLYTLGSQTLRLGGHWYECGVYKGGTAVLLARLTARSPLLTPLYLFDSFEGLPAPDPGRDDHRKGDFSETSVQAVRALVEARAPRAHVEIRKGFIPSTFKDDLPSEGIAFAHIDVDLYSSTRDCLEWIYPRMVPGGFIVCDDYGFPQCGGAREALDTYFEDKPEVPLVLGTGQAVIFRAA